jgi:hypothetical protein
MDNCQQRVNKAKSDWATEEDRYKKMSVYTKYCEESISAINLTLRKVLHKSSIKFVCPKLHDCLEGLINGNLDFQY